MLASLFSPSVSLLVSFIQFLLPSFFYYFLLHSFFYLLSFTYFLLHTFFYLFSFTYFLLPTFFYLFSFTYFLLPIFFYLLSFNYFLLPIFCHLVSLLVSFLISPDLCDAGARAGRPSHPLPPTSKSTASTPMAEEDSTWQFLEIVQQSSNFSYPWQISR